jgi:LmbE family N-acetylglucosaminyl deacetylase
MSRSLVPLLVILICLLPAQEPRGAAAVKARLDRLNVLGSVLMIAAHPDDENTALLAWCARGRNLRTAYLSLTRGEGGQNLIGSEQGDLMGLIRTQELLAARRIDGASQFFTRAIDFGFSKTAEETLAKWGREQALADTVYVIRKFRPDVIVLRFSGTPRDGHGQHQSSAMLGKEAFTAAADPNRFPEQLKYVQPWQARRVLYNVFAFSRPGGPPQPPPSGQLVIDTGEYNALLGLSYGEIAGMSRSLHRSQGMGSAERKGSFPNQLTLVAGEPAATDLMDGVDTSWNRVPGAAPVAALIEKARQDFNLERPSDVVPVLLKAREQMIRLDHPWAAIKLAETDELIAEAAGLWLDANAARHAVSPGGELKITLTAVNRSNQPVTLTSIHLPHAAPIAMEESALEYNRPFTREVSALIPAGTPPSQPYWLRKPHSGTMYSVDNLAELGEPEGPPLIDARFSLRVAGSLIQLRRPVHRRWVDPVRGELTRPVVVTPAVAVEFSERALLFASKDPRKVEVQVRAVTGAASGEVALHVPPGWKATPALAPFQLAAEDEMVAVSFQVTPPLPASAGSIRAAGRINGVETRHGVRVIAYDHIPPQTVFPPAEVSVVRADMVSRARNIGYVMGAGDDVPNALRQLGLQVTLLSDDDLARADLSAFDAIVTGVRAYNTRPQLRANQQRLMEYASQGGTVVVQYNVLEGGFMGGNPKLLEKIGPYPITISRDRVTVEEAPMTAIQPDHSLLQAPNHITPSDYEGWVQERGLYFASAWDPRYQPIWRCNDPGEKPMEGSTLYARHGKGVYIFTALAFFRQLPAGVPGAYRIFANMLSAGKLLP